MQSQSSAGEWPSRSLLGIFACCVWLYVLSCPANLQAMHLCSLQERHAAGPAVCTVRYKAVAVGQPARLFNGWTYLGPSCHPAGARSSEDGYVHWLRIKTRRPSLRHQCPFDSYPVERIPDHRVWIEGNCSKCYEQTSDLSALTKQGFCYGTNVEWVWIGAAERCNPQ